MASLIFSSEIESSSGDNDFVLLLSVGKTYLMRELEMRHQQTDVLPKTETLSVRSGHPLRNDLTLVVRVSSAAVEVPPVGDDQVEAVEVKVVVMMPFLEAKGHLQQRTLQLPKT